MAVEESTALVFLVSLSLGVAVMSLPGVILQSTASPSPLDKSSPQPPDAAEYGAVLPSDTKVSLCAATADTASTDALGAVLVASSPLSVSEQVAPASSTQKEALAGERRRPVPDPPRLLNRSDVAFAVELIERVSLPSSCSAGKVDPARSAPTKKKSTDMQSAVLAAVAEALRAVDTELLTAATLQSHDNDAEDDARLLRLVIKREVLRKADFLTRHFSPDFSEHPSPASGYHQALLRYLRRSLLL